MNIPVLPDSDEVVELREMNRQLAILIKKQRGNSWSIIITILLMAVIIELGILIAMTNDMYGVMVSIKNNSEGLWEGMNDIYIRMGNMHLY